MSAREQGRLEVRQVYLDERGRGPGKSQIKNNIVCIWLVDWLLVYNGTGKGVAGWRMDGGGFEGWYGSRCGWLNDMGLGIIRRMSECHFRYDGFSRYG